MGKLGDAFDKAKRLAGEHSDKAEKGIDKAAEMAKKKTGGKYDEHIDKAGDSAGEYLRNQGKRRNPDPGS
ncbi:antitoxin [Actinorugispora endophytica]|uniref:Antitoxin protein of toxin-antitoxin system n=1 Tax=Actinorugispora endophytica TaxID=1605990 RepID=A0A4R6URA7_9ACTN|nr:antitoxin [Actinorugispora endophytica]TDQ48746.1 antitoxin protein of toxin-antitoxin system [Actinorugispora endophytica]